MLRLTDVRLTDAGTASRKYNVGETIELRDSNGAIRRYIYLKNSTGGSLSAGGAAKLGLTNTAPYFQAIVLADATTRERILVACGTIASTYYGWFQDAGACALTVASGAYTAGHGLKVHDAIIKTTGGAWTNADSEFGIIQTGGGAVTSITAVLQGRESLGTT